MRTFSYSFLTIGKTQESKETQEFKRYVGVGTSYVLAVNPNKKELDELMGFESANEPEYLKDTDEGRVANITFIVRTNPEQCGGVEITNRLMFTLRNSPAYNSDKSKVQVIDQFGNFTWTDTQSAKEGKKLFSANGKELKVDNKYRMAYAGECDLVHFLKTYLCVQDAFNYINGSWVKKDNSDDYRFGLEHIKDYFKGDFSELKEALALQPNNKVKLLYGVRTTEDNKLYQAVSSKSDFVLRNNATQKDLAKMEQRLESSKAAGAYASTDFRVCELKEWTVEPTNLNNAPAEVAEDPFAASSELPWE